MTITFATDTLVSITFEDFDVNWCNPECSCDYLAVHDGNSTSSPIIGLSQNELNQGMKGLCGTTPKGTTIKSTGNVMTLHFISSEQYGGSGFKIYADAIIGKSTF